MDKLDDLINKIIELIVEDSEIELKNKIQIKLLLESYKPNINEINNYIYFDKSKNYTRNLISTDNKTYTLLLLCWNTNKYSPIHDHPENGCWVKIISGSINEIKYKCKNNKLIEISNDTINSGVTYIDNSIGLHKVGNPDNNIKAITLHLYSPSYNNCKIWFDTNNYNNYSISNIN
jgi:cysteine dioxygenase